MVAPSPAAGIILSGAYIAAGMVAEFGLLPPSFLPLANRRLYCWQVESLRRHVPHLTLAIPDSFVMEDFDSEWLSERDVHLCRIEEGKTLGDTITRCLQSLEKGVEDIWLLFGDTLLSDLDALPEQSVSVGVVQEHSRWGYCHKAANGSVEFFEHYDNSAADTKPVVVVGCFRISKEQLLHCLDLTSRDFYAALNLYSIKFGIELLDHGSNWHDFGHINGYFRSRQNFTTERTFNSIQIKKRKVSKFSKDACKMVAETAWFKTVPRDIDVFLPSYLGRVSRDNMTGYSTEYLFLPSVSDLFVYGRLPQYVWKQIFGSCGEFLETCRGYPGDPAVAKDAMWLYEGKTELRLKAFGQARGISLSHPWRFNGQTLPSLSEILTRVMSYIPEASGRHISVVHGDFHFANIFFDFRSLGVKVVDPRGLVRDKPVIYGDHRYDVAKLAHSTDGLYDFILSGILRADVNGYDIDFAFSTSKRIQAIQDLFASLSFGDLTPRSDEVRAIVVLLFMSMLDLHADDRARQDTLLANVFRLFLQLDRRHP